MAENQLFGISERDWLQTQLRLQAIEQRSEMLSEYYDFDDPRKIVCCIFAKYAQQMADKKAAKTEQLEYYKDWADMVKRKLLKILEKLPGLRKSFDMKSDLVVRIMYHAGMGGSLICEIVGDKITWNKNT